MRASVCVRLRPHTHTMDRRMGGNVADLQGDLFGMKTSVSLYKFEEIVWNEPELLKIRDIAAH